MRQKFKAAAVAAALLAGATGAALQTASAAQEPEQGDQTAQGCGYGQGGPYAETICWIDMSGFDFTEATTTGQDMAIDLGAGITIEFTLNLAPGDDGLRQVVSSTLPTWSRAALGNHAFVDTPGEPVLYQRIGDDTSDGYSLDRFTLDDITVRRNGQVSTDGYSFVMVDAESTGGGEGFNFSSSGPIESLAEITPDGYKEPCDLELTGLGTDAVTCRGSNRQLVSGLLLASTENPTYVGVEPWNRNGIAGSRQGVAFGVMLARVDVGKTVEQRADASDSFTVQALDGQNQSVLAEAETGSADSAESGPHAILAGAGGNPVTFTETMSSGSASALGDYEHSWACTRNGADVDPADLTGDPASDTVGLPVSIGDYVDCDVTNTGSDVPVDPTVPDNTDEPDYDDELPVTGNAWALPAALAGLALAAIGLVLARLFTGKRRSVH